MPHGQRDWSNIGAEETVHGLDDMGELAARLWSIVTHNREGNVLFMEGFEHGLAAWYTYTYGTNGYVRQSREWWRSGGYSCKLFPGTSVGGLAKIDRSFPYPVLSKYGLEFSIGFNQYIDYLEGMFIRYDGTTQHQFWFRYDYVDSDLLIRTPAGFITIDANLALSPRGTTLFHVFKLVGDCSTDRYVRLIVDNSEYNLTAYSAYTGAFAGGPYMTVWLQVNGTEGQNAFAYLDDVILTQNEP